MRRAIDPTSPESRYTGLLNTGGFAHDVTLPSGMSMASGVMEFWFGRPCFLSMTLAPDGDVWWFANLFSTRELRPDELETNTASTTPTWTVAGIPTDGNTCAR